MQNLKTVVKCAKCGTEVVIETATKDGKRIYTMRPCSTCMTREFNEGREYDRRMRAAR